MDTPTTTRRVRRVRQEPKRRELTVRRVEALGPGFVAVTFAGEALADFSSGSFDDHVKFMLESPQGEPLRRDYTPRRYSAERQELVIEFALHGHGAASEWARRAAVGQRVVVAGPRGSLIIPVDYEWHLLIGDATALPAISRRLEELPADAQVTVIGLAAPDDRRAFDGPPALAVQWVASPGELLAAVRASTFPVGEGFVWAAGEASTMAGLRKLLVEVKRHPKEAMRVAAYWKHGAVGHHENLED